MIVRTLALGAVAVILLVGGAGASSWGGYYLGLHAGHGKAESDTTRELSGAGYFDAVMTGEVEGASLMSLEEETLTGGAQIGMNWPVSEYFLFGLELDAAGFGNDTSGGATAGYSCCALTGFTTTNSVEQTWFATARARIGINTSWFLLYGTGGYAGGEIEFTQTFTDTLGPVPLQVIENSEFRSGYSYGGGIELMIESGASLRFEYLILDLGEITTAGPIGPAATHTSAGRAEVKDEIIRAGINFQMD
jgi:outer membrane immunogenic protein